MKKNWVEFLVTTLVAVIAVLLFIVWINRGEIEEQKDLYENQKKAMKIQAEAFNKERSEILAEIVSMEKDLAVFEFLINGHPLDFSEEAELEFKNRATAIGGRFNPGISVGRLKLLVDVIWRECKRWSIDPYYSWALTIVESNYLLNDKSNKGALGYRQLMVPTGWWAYNELAKLGVLKGDYIYKDFAPPNWKVSNSWKRSVLVTNPELNVMLGVYVEYFNQEYLGTTNKFFVYSAYISGWVIPRYQMRISEIFLDMVNSNN